MKFKALAAAFLVSFGITAEAASPAATLDWVKAYVAQQLANYSGGGSSSTNTARSFHRTFTSDITISNEVYELAITLDSTTNLALVVISSDVPGVTNGTIYAWNSALGSFNTVISDGMPVVSVRAYHDVTISTNIFNEMRFTTNTFYTFSANVNGTNYWSTTYYGKRYLVSDRGFNKGRIEFSTTYATDDQIRIARGASYPVSRAFSMFLSAYADTSEDSEIMTHNNGTITVTSVAITKKGKTKIEYLAQDEKFLFDSGIGDGSVGAVASAAFNNWLSTPVDSNYTEPRNDLKDRCQDYSNWGVPDNPNGKFITESGTAVLVGQITSSEAWKDAIDAAKAWIVSEYENVFRKMWETLKNHYCPSLGPDNKYWTPELNCKCQHRYHAFPESGGEWEYCEHNDECQHLWKRMAVVNGVLMILDDNSVGCIRCARCGQCREDEGAYHETVPDTYDYCGCYCMYYYQKKAEEEEPEPEPPPPPDIPPEIPPIIWDEPDVEPEVAPTPEEQESQEECEPEDYPITDVEVIEDTPRPEEEKEETVTTHDQEGEEVEIVVPKKCESAFQTVTNQYEYSERKKFFGEFFVIWRKDFSGKWQKMIVSQRSAEQDAERKYHPRPEEPYRCTCNCGCTHWFKPSPCPDVCRGCQFVKEAFTETPGALKDGRKKWKAWIRGYHCKMEDGYWDDETYYDRDGVQHTWSNKDGDIFYPSKWSNWYYGTQTGGCHVCGCACGRFYSTPDGAGGKPGRNADGEKVDDGHHGSFHIYGLRDVTEIACPFTRYYYIEHVGGITKLKSCSCNNHDWEAATKYGYDEVSGDSYMFYVWVGRLNDQTPSLACPEVCMWCWPSNHYAGGVQLNAKRHTGIGKIDSVVTGDVATAYANWYSSELGDGLVCGCICQALNESTCSDSEDDPDRPKPFEFEDAWKDIVNSNYHVYDFEESCLCQCSSAIHLALTEERFRELFPDPDSRPNVQFTDCSRGGDEEEGSVCAVCGFYDKDGRTNDLVRAEIAKHAIASGHCACHCSLQDRESDGKHLFADTNKNRNRDKAYNGSKLRGWSAEQDGFNYPNNTHEGTTGYTSDLEDLDLFHKSAKGYGGYPCCCRCAEKNANTVLYHEIRPGDACTDCCKAKNANAICGHKENYYVKKDGYWQDDPGQHCRTNSEAAYCGCDCGYDPTVGGILGYLAGHCGEDGECFCYGHYSTSTYHDHGDPVLLEHVNPRVNDDNPGEAYETPCSVCGRGIVHSIENWICDNGHEWTVVNEDLHNHPNVCEICGHTKDYADECDCYCHIGGIGDSGVFNICDPILTASGLQRALGGVTLNDIFGVDGDEPVYSIADNALTNAFRNLPKLEFVHFNFCTNIGSRALAGTFSGCTALKDVSFKALGEISYGSLSNTFTGCSAITNMDFSAVTNLGRNALQELAPAQVLHLEHLGNVSPLFTKSLCACNVATVRLDYVKSVLPKGPFFGDDPTNMKVVIPSILRSLYDDAGWPAANLVETNTLEFSGWIIYRDGVRTDPWKETAYPVWDQGLLRWDCFECPYPDDMEGIDWSDPDLPSIDDNALIEGSEGDLEVVLPWGADSGTAQHHVYRYVRTLIERH